MEGYMVVDHRNNELGIVKTLMYEKLGVFWSNFYEVLP